MKLILILAIILGAAICQESTANEQCYTAMQAVVKPLNDVIAARKAKNEQLEFSTLKSSSEVLNTCIATCNSIVDSKDFKSFADGIKEKGAECLRGVYDSIFLAASGRDLLEIKDWQNYFSTMDYLTQKWKSLNNGACSQFFSKKSK